MLSEKLRVFIASRWIPHALAFENSLGTYFRDLLVLKTIFNCLFFLTSAWAFVGDLCANFDPFFPENSFDKEIASFLLIANCWMRKEKHKKHSSP